MTIAYRHALACAIPCCLSLVTPISARARDRSSDVATSVDATLDPGDYVWTDESGTAGPVSVIVSLTDQRAYVYRGGALIGVSSVSTGKPGYETPTGRFTILQKQLKHRSNKYESAPMPYMQRITWDGVALHAGGDPGYPTSHGCVHLPAAFAKKLYAVTRLGATVEITDASYTEPTLSPPDVTPEDDNDQPQSLVPASYSPH